MGSILLFFQSLQEKFSSFSLRQKISLVVTVFVLLAIPITLFLLKHQQIFRSKASEPSGLVKLYDPGIITERDEIANSKGKTGVVNSQLVSLQITFPDWTQASIPSQKHLAKDKAAEQAVLQAATGPGCANADGNINNDATRHCTDWVKSGGDDSEYCYPGTKGEYASNINAHYFASCPINSSPPTNPVSSNPATGSAPTSQVAYCCGDNNRKTAEGTYCNGAYDDKNLYCGACGNGTYSVCYKCQLGESCTGENITPSSKPPSPTTAYCCGNNNRENANGSYCNGSYDPNNLYCGACGNGTYSVCYSCQAGEKCVGNPTASPTGGEPKPGDPCDFNDSSLCSKEGINGLYCRKFNNENNGHWVTKDESLARCNNASTSVQFALTPCLDDNLKTKHTYLCDNGEYKVATETDLKNKGLAIAGPGNEGGPICCASDSDCPNSSCDLNSVSTVGDCGSFAAKDAKPHLCRTSGQPAVSQTPAPPSGGQERDQTCSDSLPCKAGLECVRTGRDGREINERTCQPSEQRFTRYIFIKNENGDFNDENRRVVFSFSDQESLRYSVSPFVIRYYALSDGIGQKDVVVRFCQTQDVNGTCREQTVHLEVKKLQTNPPAEPALDQAMQAVKDKLEKLGEKVTLEDGSLTLEKGDSANIPKLTSFDNIDLEFLVYVLKSKLNIHPYYALCHIFNESSDSDRGRLHDVLTKYGVDAPILPAIWTSAQLQQLNDPIYKDVSGNNLKDGRGPLPLPCDIQSPVINQIFSYTNNPNLEQRNQLLAGNSGLKLPDIDFSNPTERKNFEDKLSALILLEQLTWQSATIPLGSAAEYAVSIAEMMPLTTPGPALAQIWKYILPGDTIIEALKLNDKGAPLGFTAASYGGKVVGSLAMLAVPVGGVPAIEGEVGSRVALAIRGLAERSAVQEEKIIVSITTKEVIDGSEQEVVRLFSNDEDAALVGQALQNPAGRMTFAVSNSSNLFRALGRQLGATDGKGSFWKTLKYADNTRYENDLIDQLNWGISKDTAFPLSRTRLYPTISQLISDIQNTGLRWYVTGGRLSLIQDIFNRRYIWFVTDAMYKKVGGPVYTYGFAKGRVIVLNASELEGIFSFLLNDFQSTFAIRHEFVHAIQKLIRQQIDGEVTGHGWIYTPAREITIEVPDKLSQLLSNMYELETDAVANIGLGYNGGYRTVIPNFYTSYQAMKARMFQVTGGQIHDGSFAELALSGDQNILAGQFNKYPAAKRIFQDFLRSFGIDFRGTVFE